MPAIAGIFFGPNGQARNLRPVYNGARLVVGQALDFNKGRTRELFSIFTSRMDPDQFAGCAGHYLYHARAS